MTDFGTFADRVSMITTWKKTKVVVMLKGEPMNYNLTVEDILVGAEHVVLVVGEGTHEEVNE